MIGARIGSWLLDRAWNIGAVVGIVASLYLGIQLLQARSTIKDRNATIAQRDSRITQLTNDLAQARTNVSTLQDALNQQNAQLRNLSEQSKATIAAMAKEVESANAASAKAGKRARDTLNYRPKGETQCARVLDVDRRLLETLK